MSFLNFKKKKTRRRVAVIGLDGVPYHQIIDLSGKGLIPNISKIMQDGLICEMKSSSPPVSPVSWTTCVTGVNPAKHGIFGQMERRRESYGIYFPNGLQVASPSIWDLLTAVGKTSVAVNVPHTYPTKEIKGVLISGPVSLDLNKAIYPAQICSALEQIDYRIDVDFNKFLNDRGSFYKELLYMLKKRRETFSYFINRVDWDFFMGVITGTGRLNRYLWHDYINQGSEYHQQFIDYFKEVDTLVGEIAGNIYDNTELILMSDRGMATSKRDVYLNTWLKNEGLLKLKEEGNGAFDNIDPAGTKVFALDSGRIYINHKGLMPSGCVEPGKEYDRLRKNLIEGFLTLKDESIGTPFISSISRKEDIFQGPLADRAPDLVLEGIPGYDLRSEINEDNLFGEGKHEGTSTGHDAFFSMRGLDTLKTKPRIIDLFPTILSILDTPCVDKN